MAVLAAVGATGSGQRADTSTTARMRRATRNRGEKAGLHPTLINPTKAFAVARYEAFQFEKDAEWIPATRFLFFATRKGGYWDFDGDIKSPTAITNFW
jgi:hypothetical protein